LVDSDRRQTGKRDYREVHVVMNDSICTAILYPAAMTANSRRSRSEPPVVVSQTRFRSPATRSEAIGVYTSCHLLVLAPLAPFRGEGLGERGVERASSKRDRRHLWCTRTLYPRPFSPAKRPCSFATSTAQRGRSDAGAAGRGSFELEDTPPPHPLPGLRARPLPKGEVTARNTRRLYNLKTARPSKPGEKGASALCRHSSLATSSPGALRDPRPMAWNPFGIMSLQFCRWCALIALALVAIPHATADESEYYRLLTVATSKADTQSRSKVWKPAPEDLVLEVSGIAPLDDAGVAVSIRKGEIWIIDGVYDDPPENLKYHRFAQGLHEPLGLAYRDDAFYTVQRSELTRIRDTDDDDFADEYLALAKGWGTTGNYHEYAYGPKFDGAGNLWLTLNIGMGVGKAQQRRLITDSTLGVSQARWRGWGMKVTPAGELIPVCAGMRSPSGLGPNREGDMFYTDQQGNWVGTNTLHHMRSGAFFHHPEALASMNEPGSPITGITSVPNGVPFPEALKRMPQLRPPAVWFPYKKVGQSTTDIMLDDSGGRFGPFDGQLFVGEFTLSSVNRVFLEKVGGEYQGACFPFREGFASAVIRMAQGLDGSMLVGLSNRGWSSLGPASYGLQRLVWTGKTPFEIKEMRARSDGFELVFTKPADPETAADVSAYSINSHTYTYHATYGSDEIQKRELEIRQARPSADGLRVDLVVDGLREHFVHELVASGVRSTSGDPLLHPDAYYTLNRIP
jgi:glucose/arabinose dehydrogenase